MSNGGGVILPGQIQLGIKLADGPNAVPATMVAGNTVMIIGGLSKRETIAMHLMAQIAVLPEERLKIDGEQMTAAQVAVAATDDLIRTLAETPDPNDHLYPKQ